MGSGECKRLSKPITSGNLCRVEMNEGSFCHGDSSSAIMTPGLCDVTTTGAIFSKAVI